MGILENQSYMIKRGRNMFNFPKDLYTDVRIDNYYETKVRYSDNTLVEIKNYKYEGVFIRIFDGNHWHYCSFAGKNHIQEEIDALAKQVKPNSFICDHPIVKRLEANKDRDIQFPVIGFYNMPLNDKVEFVSRFPEKYMSQCKLLSELSTHARFIYNLREFYSSKGADLYYDDQVISLVHMGTFINGDNCLVESFEKCAHRLEEIDESVDRSITETIRKAEEYVTERIPIEPGAYPVVLGYEVMGLFCHESLGHKSEADFSVGSPGMQKFWHAGDQVASEDISIIDNGIVEDALRIPYDDEGTKARATFVIKNGKIDSLLTDVSSACNLNIENTGNARAIDYTWEPIVRMTTIYMTPGNKTEEELIAGIDKGIYVENYVTGGGMDIFSIIPGRCYLIENGKITKPVAVTLISGKSTEALRGIEGRSNQMSYKPTYYTMCGKPPQIGLPTAEGGPVTKFRSLNVI